MMSWTSTHKNGQISSKEMKAVGGQLFEPHAAQDLAYFGNAFAAARKKKLVIGQGYRPRGKKGDKTATTQEGAWYIYKTHGKPIAAVPGTSNHGFGLAADLWSGIDSFGTADHAFAVKFAPLFGWSWGSTPSEPWHFQHLQTKIYWKHPTVKQGARGLIVQLIQTILNAHGARLVVDGIYGPATAKAAKTSKITATWWKKYGL